MKDAMIAFVGKEKPAFTFDMPDGLTLKADDGEESEIVAKVRKHGDKLELISVNGIALNSADPDDQEDEWEGEEAYENEAGAEGQAEMESDSLGARAKAAGFM